MSKSDWTVHPNRSEIGPDEPGRNGHFRTTMTRPRPEITVSVCLARVELPAELSEQADPDGSVTFGGLNWWFVVGTAHTFARTYTDVEVPPPFGFKRRGQWWWWDDTTTDESILDGPDAAAYVEEYFELLFPGLIVTVTDNRDDSGGQDDVDGR
ncbi:hypothetical protein BKG82_28545 [Mycobacteroides chelonae]|uniref:Uncharacterized protein n=2 Tax=Mycobacteroides chelonae TaxID=1774 RepID=A0A1S1LHC5_MYCCH|nr:hypothetical protein BKG82_28545 [Mycobacteroides chelonae]